MKKYAKLCIAENMGNPLVRKSARYTTFSSLSQPVEANENPSIIPHRFLKLKLNGVYFVVMVSIRYTICVYPSETYPRRSFAVIKFVKTL